MIDVVDHVAGGRGHYLGVHPDVSAWSAVCSGGVAAGVEGPSAAAGVPIIGGEARVVLGVNDGVFAAGEWNAAEGIAVAKPAVEEHQRDDDALDGGRDNDFYVEPNQSGRPILFRASASCGRSRKTRPHYWTNLRV